MKLKQLITGLGVILLSSQCLAAHEGKQEKFNQLDTDHDGYISQDELKLPGDRMFQSADLDKDGRVSLQELEDRAQKRMNREHKRQMDHFKALDQDSDGYITEAEVKLALFKRMDKDGDGRLSIDELKPPHRTGRGFDRSRRHTMDHADAPDA